MTLSRPATPVAVARWRGLVLALPKVGLLGYALVWLVPVLALAWRIVGGTLAGDLFEHAAAVRELATHPFQPGNPILLVDLPHTLFSPYSLLAAAIVRLTGMDPFNVLALAGFVNVVILAAGFRAFVRIFSRSDLALILAAIFAFFLWGSAPLHLGIDPWIWSGFLNLDSLSYGLPYPSALAMGLAFFALALLASYLQRGGRARLVAVLVIQAVVVILHPYTALFIVIGLGALLVGHGSRAEIRRATAAIGVVGVGSLIALAWPYFSIVQLLTGQQGAFDPEQREMYSAVLLRVFPALVGVPFLIARLKTSRRDPLAWLLAGLSAAYVLGYLTARYTLGRELPYVIICLDVALAISVASVVSRPPEPAPVDPAASRRSRLPVRTIALICLVPVLVLGATTFVEVLTTGDSHADVEGLARQTGQYDVVLADQASYPAVPTWGGKLVAWNGALAFVPDIAQRRSQVAAFFDSAESMTDRIALLHEYSVRWVIYDSQAATSSADFLASIAGWGTPFASSPDGTYVLVSVNP
jgi:hypothetical protein